LLLIYTCKLHWNVNTIPGGSEKTKEIEKKHENEAERKKTIEETPIEKIIDNDTDSSIVVVQQNSAGPTKTKPTNAPKVSKRAKKILSIPTESPTEAPNLNLDIPSLDGDIHATDDGDDDDAATTGEFLLIYICNFHVLSNLLLIYICQLHWNHATDDGDDVLPPRQVSSYRQFYNHCFSYRQFMITMFISAIYYHYVHIVTL
jgi:hypothetical protein